MRTAALLLVGAFSLSAAPLFWEHENVRPNFFEPTLPVVTPGNLNLFELNRQSPQNQIWYTGGIVGYFSTQWDLPIWTTPAQSVERVERNERFTEVEVRLPRVPEISVCPPSPHPTHPVTPVPEPGTFGLAGAALLLAILVKKGGLA